MYKKQKDGICIMAIVQFIVGIDTDQIEDNLKGVPVEYVMERLKSYIPSYIRDASIGDIVETIVEEHSQGLVPPVPERIDANIHVSTVTWVNCDNVSQVYYFMDSDLASRFKVAKEAQAAEAYYPVLENLSLPKGAITTLEEVVRHFREEESFENDEEIMKVLGY